MTVTPSDAMLRDILTHAKSFACVGVSPNPIRPSHFVARYLSLRGYRVIPVNPVHTGAELFGEQIVGDVAEIDGPVDVLDVFRRSEVVPPLVEDALAKLPNLICVWLQVGVISPEAEAMCDAAGVPIIQNRCPKIEYQRLFGELRQGGFNTGIISSKLPR